MVSYLPIGTELDASHWNTLYGELDTKICNAAGSQSIALWGEGADYFGYQSTNLLYHKRFYFTDRTFLTNPSASIANWYMSLHMTPIPPGTGDFDSLWNR